MYLAVSENAYVTDTFKPSVLPGYMLTAIISLPTVSIEYGDGSRLPPTTVGGRYIYNMVWFLLCNDVMWCAHIVHSAYL